MQGYITIEPDVIKKGSVQIRAHCRATKLTECNRTLLWNVHPHQVKATQTQAEGKLKRAGCDGIETNDLRLIS